MTSSLLLGLCVCCNEPIFRHRISGRQITCAELRRLDEQLLHSGAQPEHQPRREFQVVPGGRDRDETIGRAITEISIHGGER